MGNIREKKIHLILPTTIVRQPKTKKSCKHRKIAFSFSWLNFLAKEGCCKKFDQFEKHYFHIHYHSKRKRCKRKQLHQFKFSLKFQLQTCFGYANLLGIIDSLSEMRTVLRILNQKPKLRKSRKMKTDFWTKIFDYPASTFFIFGIFFF